MDLLTLRVARRYKAAADLRENEARLNEADKLRKKLLRLRGQLKYDEKYQVTNAEAVLPKMLGTFREIGTKLTAAYEDLDRFNEETEAINPDAKYAKTALTKRLADAKRALSQVNEFVRDPSAYVKGAVVSYGGLDRDGPDNLVGHMVQLSLEAFTSVRASNTIAWSFKHKSEKTATLVERVAHRFRVRTTAEERLPVMDLRELKITSENLEEVLNGLIAGVDDLEGVEKRLGLDLRNMTQLMRQYPHNDDLYHNGEDVLTHIGWVMDDVAKLSANMDAEKRVLLKLTGLCHDLGKAYTYAYDPERKKHTFYDHATKSVEIAEALLAKHKGQLGKLYQQVLDFTRLHDVFYALAYERTKLPEGSTKYVRRIMDEAIYQDGLLQDLLAFARADSYRARAHADKLKETEAVLEDVKREERAAEEAIAAKARLRQITLDRMPQIRAYLEPEAPEAAAALPDLQAAKRLLGTMKRYDLLKGIEVIIRAV